MLGAFASYLPTLRRFGLWPFWALALPLVACFYMAATIGSRHRPPPWPRPSSGNGAPMGRRARERLGRSAIRQGQERRELPRRLAADTRGTAPPRARLLRFRPQCRRHRRQRHPLPRRKAHPAERDGSRADRRMRQLLRHRTTPARQPAGKPGSRPNTRSTCCTRSARTPPRRATPAGPNCWSIAATSAAPVGRHVLDLHGESPATYAPSDPLCRPRCRC